MCTPTFDLAHIHDLADETVVVTGANSGVGLATADALAGAGARVVLAVRDARKGKAAAGGCQVFRVSSLSLSV
jgi:NAD(P)-dependent dehydrogenase (short-subunit alcohol dehydrogenase family)